MGCGNQATYNFKGKKRGSLCVEHKLDDMICVKKIRGRRCRADNCMERATWNYMGQPKP
ncbi:unnamed protein product, partial [Heterosigma akashiwo]